MKHTIVIKQNGILYKIAKMVFGSDGSYYITAPYHQANKAILFKTTVDYDEIQTYSVDEVHLAPISEFLDLGSTDESNRVKLSYHPDGFVQFSGPGVRSGREPDGSPKGIGVVSTPLGDKFNGPAFILGFSSLDDFPQVTEPPRDMFLLDADAIYLIPGCSGLEVDVHYFPPIWYRFIRRSARENEDTILLKHPWTSVVELKVLKMPENCAIPGFFGFDLFSTPVSDAKAASEGSITTFVSLSGPSGNIRLDENGHRLGDAIFCQYRQGPVGKQWLGRKLDFTGPEPAS